MYVCTYVCMYVNKCTYVCARVRLLLGLSGCMFVWQHACLRVVAGVHGVRVRAYLCGVCYVYVVNIASALLHVYVAFALAPHNCWRNVGSPLAIGVKRADNDWRRLTATDVDWRLSSDNDKSVVMNSN